MHTREAPDFWRLHKNVNCAFPLSEKWKKVLNNKGFGGAVLMDALDTINNELLIAKLYAWFK